MAFVGSSLAGDDEAVLVVASSDPDATAAAAADDEFDEFDVLDLDLFAFAGGAFAVFVAAATEEEATEEEEDSPPPRTTRLDFLGSASFAPLSSGATA